MTFIVDSTNRTSHNPYRDSRSVLNRIKLDMVLRYFINNSNRGKMFTPMTPISLIHWMSFDRSIINYLNPKFRYETLNLSRIVRVNNTVTHHGLRPPFRPPPRKYKRRYLWTVLVLILVWDTQCWSPVGKCVIYSVVSFSFYRSLKVKPSWSFVFNL